MSLSVRLLIIMAFALGVKGNALNEAFVQTCSPSQMIYRILGISYVKRHDRAWTFMCKSLPVRPGEADCHWGGYSEVPFDKLSVYQCPGQGYLIGVNSTYHKEKMDRDFQFRCCERLNYFMHGCSFSPWQTTLRSDNIVFDMPINMVLRGVMSYYDSQIRDRRFPFNLCFLDRLHDHYAEFRGY